MKVKKLHKDAVMPNRAHNDDAGYDITAIDDGNIKVVQTGNNDGKTWRMLYIEYKTGLAIEPPVGYHIELVARSSVSKTDLILANCVAVGDQGYRGEYRFRFKCPSEAHRTVWAKSEKEASETFKKYMSNAKIYKAGDKIGQMLIRATVLMDIQEVDELSDTVRGIGGFGSTDIGKDIKYVKDQLEGVANDPDLILGGGGGIRYE
jgi:dUTP pyrophosphatase